VLTLATAELRRAAPAPVDVIPLGPKAPFGGLIFRTEACTLCLACVGVCPTHALTDSQERPLVAFDESLCVQCGLCANTCPEDVITLQPQIDFAAWEAPRRVLKEEEPCACIACGKAFGTRSTVERVIKKLEGQHWMFAGEVGRRRIDVLRMCEDCRVNVAVSESFDPHARERPKPMTSEDFFAAREKSGLPN
jgi:ferredoxin